MLADIRQAARFPARIANLIKRGAEIAPKETDTKANLAAIGKRIKDIERRIERVELAIETSGGELHPLVDRVEELERERLTEEGERIRMEAKESEQGL